MNKINICLDSKIWISKLPNIEKIVKKILQKSISSEKKITNSNVEVTILLTNTKKMTILNQKYRKIKKDTDVLSFPAEKPIFYKRKKINSKYIYLGDLAVSYNYIKNKTKIDFKQYLKKILIHGFLHLVGHDHNNENNYIKMEKAHKRITNLI